MEITASRDGMVAESANSDGSPGSGTAGFPAPGELALRHRFVLGIFAGRAAAEQAVAQRLSGSDRVYDVLVLSDDGLDGRTDRSAGCRSGCGRCAGAACGTPYNHVQVHVDALGSLGPAVNEALSRSGSFAPLAERLRDPDTGPGTASAGTPRPFQNIVHHLAGGATVVLVRVASSEQQLRTSRAFLEAGCEVLLTHELMSPAAG